CYQSSFELYCASIIMVRTSANPPPLIDPSDGHEVHLHKYIA
ncbi:hypothetical protein A2U01_0054963, partial [Trifolium medium]|nr:hypothetical protein [Trifolium medium]